MSQINTVLVKDDLLCYSDSIDFAVEVSGQNVSTQRFPSTSATSNSQVYTIQVPSITTVISREILRHETFQLLVSGTAPLNGYLVNLGVADCSAPFPLHQLTTNMNLQINNSSVSVQTNEILDPILRCMERKRLNAISNYAPTQLDVCGDYSAYLQNNQDIVNSLNSPFAGYQYAVDSDSPPRGSYVVKVQNCDASGKLSGDAVNDYPQVAGDGTNTLYSLITMTSTEPLFISPLVFGDYDNKSAGFTGINQINLTCNLDSTARRAWRYIDQTVGTNKTVRLFGYVDGECYLECRFLTPKPDMVMPATCVSPYAQYNLFKSNYGTMTAGQQLTVPSTSIQLNGVPDMAIIFVRQPIATDTGRNSDCYATIKNVSINFNNSTSVCANFSQQMLWKMSKEAGSNQSWLEFSGQATYSLVPNTSGIIETDPQWLVRGTTGSIVALKFGEHIQLTDSWTAPSSMGNYNFQVQVQAINNTGVDLTNCELCVIMVNSGIFTSQAGQSSLFTNLLSKSQVLDAQTKEPVSGNEIRRLVGSGFLSRLKTIAHHAAKHVVPHLANLAKSHLAKSDSPLARLAEHAIDTGRQVSGYGMSAGNRRLQKHLM